MDKAKFGRSRSKVIHTLSLPLIAAELGVLVAVKDIEGEEG